MKRLKPHPGFIKAARQIGKDRSTPNLAQKPRIKKIRRLEVQA